ncbi:MAG: hypothetical protein HQL11_06805, partial [Candidatus Omnitrophica bacterium]|nr:hypothetical protein [Candidatus Omnitrophota bacterium]
MFKAKSGQPSGRFRDSGAALLLYTLCTLVFFAPVLGRLGSSLIGPPEDNMQFFWFLWYGSKALWDPALSFMHTRMIYFPEGVGLFWANYFYAGV